MVAGSQFFIGISYYLGALKILLPIFLKILAAIDSVFRNLYGKLYFHQCLLF